MLGFEAKCHQMQNFLLPTFGETMLFQVFRANFCLLWARLPDLFFSLYESHICPCLLLVLAGGVSSPEDKSCRTELMAYSMPKGE